MAWVFGVIFALPAAWLLDQGIGAAFIFEPLPFTFSWLAVGHWLMAPLLIGSLGATRPARTASRLTIREILAYE